MRALIASLALCLLVAAPAAAATLSVPADYPTIQSAVDAAVSGDTISVAAGTFVEDVVVFQRQGLTIKGAKGAVVDNESGAPCLVVWDSDDIVIIGLTFRPTEFTAYGARISGSRSVSFMKCAFDGCTVVGLDIQPWVGDSADVLVSQCLFTNMGGKGLDEYKTQGLTVTKCVFDLVGEYAIGISWTNSNVAQDVSLVGNRILRAGIGIRLDAPGSIVSKNLLKDMTTAGIVVDGSTTVTGSRIEKNTITGVPETAIHLTGDGNALVGNKLTDVGTGILAEGTGHRIEKNAITNTALAGIRVRSNDTRVLGNKIKDAGGRTGSPGDEQSGIIVANGGGDYEKNKVTGARGNGFLVMFGGCTYLACSAKGSWQFDLKDVVGSGTSEYSKCKFATQEFTGP